ncbi:MAG: GldG family protein [Myxococcota bacterium]
MGILLAIFGLVLLLFGLVALFLGAPLLVAGVHFVLAVACLAGSAASGFSQLAELWAQDATRRGLKYGGNTLLQTLLLGAILALVAFLSARYPKHWDWTEGRIHSLSEATREVLHQIPEELPVEVLAFYVQGGQERGRELLDRYRYEGARIEIKVYDPNKRPDLAQQHEVRTDGVLIVCGGPCESAKGTVRVTQVSEQELTKAIRRVISERKKVYFLTGHGEGDPGGSQADGYSRAKLSLQDENLEVETLLLANREEVPGDAAAVIVAGPSHSLLPRELEALDRYVKGGGSVMVLADPIVVSNVEPRVREWGVELGRDVIVDQQIQLFAGPQLGVQPIVTDYGSHPITRDLKTGRSPTLFQLARSVRAADGVPDGEVVELVRTGRSSWAETDVETFVKEGRVSLDPGQDRVGPVAIGVAREFDREGDEAEKGRAGRLVVFGDADFARNRYIAEFFNADLFLNAVNWLVGEEEFITIERHTPRASTVMMTARQVTTFQYLGIFVLPELVLLLGIWSWWRRRT